MSWKDLSINPQAKAVLRLLKDSDFPKGARLKTFAYYNGREKGVTLEVESFDLEKAFTVIWYECRNGDSILVESFPGTHYLNPPSKGELPGKKGSDPVGGGYVGYREYGKARELIIKLVKDHFRISKQGGAK